MHWHRGPTGWLGPETSGELPAPAATPAATWLNATRLVLAYRDQVGILRGFQRTSRSPSWVPITDDARLSYGQVKGNTATALFARDEVQRLIVADVDSQTHKILWGVWDGSAWGP